MVKRIAIIGLFFIVGCVSNTIYSTKFPIEIANVFYETNENQTIFTIEFQKSLPSNFVLKKLYFKNQDAEVIQNSSQKATAVFRKPDFILDSNPINEFGNQPNININNSYELKDTEALLEYFKNGKIKRFKITNVMEKSNK